MKVLFVVLALIGWTTGSKILCNGRGYRDSTGNCVCSSNFHGENCEYRYCPFGKSWIGMPFADNIRNVSLSPCSDMGWCNLVTGECECREGYEGRACERLACPTSIHGMPNSLRTLTTITKAGNTSIFLPSDITYVAQCSGHGVCKTLREASLEFDGRNLVSPAVNYNNWDADKIQGCLCDQGWEGYDCSRRSCPKGKDPNDPETKYTKEEVFYLQCQANSGYFSILVLGHYTEPIPFDADPGYLKFALESLPNVGRVAVIIAADSTGLPEVCSSSEVVTTSIQFLDHFGSRPPILVTRNTSNTRQWPSGSTSLNLNGASPILRLKTIYKLSCPNCHNCYGSVYFTYKSSISASINITSLNATAEIKHMLSNLPDLKNTNWPNFGLSVSHSGGVDAICNSGVSTTFTINLFSDIGNIDGLQLIDGSVAAGNITLTNNKGNGTLFDCSNQGTCDYSTGICSCNQLYLNGIYQYRAMSSDGHQNLGTRGDCGFLNPPLTDCTISHADACNNRGRCANDTKICHCYSDWTGLTCNFKQCPKGPAIFDEPILNDTAHLLAECSNAGLCDRLSGYCACRPGFSGPACQLRDCPRDSLGASCSGHGLCVNIAEFYAMFGFSYGSISQNYLGGETWDAFTWYECLCASHPNFANRRWNTYFPVGPSTPVSGMIPGAMPIPGWESWDCSKRSCSRGHDPKSGQALPEIQRVLCRDNRFTNKSFSFQLSLFGEITPHIFSTYSSFQIKSAIETISSVGNVSVWFPNYFHDNLAAACNETYSNSSHAGFLVRFETEFGDLPLMTVVTNTDHVTVSEFQNGISTNSVCSGSRNGFCDYDTGLCLCNRGKFSSNGLGKQGISGDCGYTFNYPRTDDPRAMFG